MVTKRVVSSKYLGGYFAIATVFVTGLGSTLQAKAQGLNAQTQAIITAPLPVTPPVEEVASQLTRMKTQPQAKCIPNNQQLKSFIEGFRGITGEQKTAFPARLNATTKLDNLSDARRFFAQNPDICKQLIPEAVIPPQTPTLSAGGGQPTKVKVSLVLNPTYETDVLKSGNNSSPGVSAGFGSNVLVTSAGLRPLDLYSLSAAEGSSRYAPFSSQSSDVVNSYFAYTAFLHADGYQKIGNDGVFIADVDPNKPSTRVPDQNMATIDTATFGLQNQTLFVPTFHRESVDFFTPQVTLSRQNINLDGGDLRCSLPLDAFCDFANVSLNVGQSFSDVATQQNFNVAGSAAIGKRIDGNWTIQLQGTVTGKEYEHVAGGRQDLLLQVGPVLTYVYTSPHKTRSVTFQLPVTYYQNYSTLSAAAWSGLVVQPTLTIAFSYTAPAASMPK